ncbi:MAPEG family protein [uncultured Paracoccus sp.]|uniref:MAPEG family protein n=1 Tax=uncultured Paracoccus sp. TaxID=189685 RepID=UPI00262C8A78|nr:MAPEG family protein [uncultured Paracoccus sp.]
MSVAPTAELAALGLAAILQAGQIALAGWSMNRDVGPRWNAGPRDSEPELSPLTGRLRRAVANHFEALAFFTIAVVMVQLTGSNGTLTAICAWIYLLARMVYVPAYAFGWSPGRSIVFGVGFVATMVMIVAGLF